MVRKLIIMSTIVLMGLQAAAALAGTSDTGPGCGLGKHAWEDSKLGQGVGPQVLMSTTNAPTMPFGITTGTLGCKNNGQVWAEEKTRIFAKLNFENLSQDMAQGRGEHLASLATLMGVPVEQQPAFFALSQERYQELLRAGQTSTAAMLTALHDAMAQHPVLAKISMNR